MNRLRLESSPYLLQHANNPVDWYPWGAEALEKAKKENKLIVVSIGYSACHWCHVMEHESFEDNEVAEVMNALYVNIKVDREERPDIDQVYMSALQLMNGTGGWPLNCILLPDGRPVYGGTYFRKNDWINILSNIAAIYRNKPQELLDYADKLIDGVRKMEFVSTKSTEKELPKDFLQKHLENWMRFLDLENGGTVGAPKFPVPCNLQFLLMYQHFYPQDVRGYFLHNTLHRIARGGIYDQVGGGIYRYSVDGVWKIPHFEKMLYDQAQMISLYADAYAKYKTPLYLQTLNTLIDFCNRELYNESDHLYYSALDADSEGVEGKYYCYTLAELHQVLGQDAVLFAEYFQCTEEGNFEHGFNNLFMTNERTAFFEKHNLAENEWEHNVQISLQKLFNYRQHRIRPGLDDKQLCAWNALMVKGLCDAYKATSNIEYKTQALKTTNSILEKLYLSNGLYRNYKNNKSTVPAFLDDYSFSIQALIAVYEISAETKYLHLAHELSKHVMKHFFDEQSGLFWYTSSSAEELVARKQEYYDSVIPSSNAIMLSNLRTLATYLDITNYSDIADSMLFTMVPMMNKYPPSFSVWAKHALLYQLEEKEIVIVGNMAEVLYTELAKNYFPEVSVVYATQEQELSLFQNRYKAGQTLIYVCKNKSCQLPVITTNEALQMLH